MSGSRVDVQRLFRHFGLDPAQYVELRTSPSLAPVAVAARAPALRPADRVLIDSGNADLLDYRNFELGC